MKARINAANQTGIVTLSLSVIDSLYRQSLPTAPPAQMKELSLNPEKLADLIPAEGDYIYPEFRALSAAYLGAGGYYLDFSREGVLKKSIPLMLTTDQGGARKKVLKLQRNHSYNVEDTLGTMASAKWNTGEKFRSPGINVIAALDWKIAPNEARGLLSDPPLIDSVSVSVEFNWERSHPDLGFWQFVDMLGHEVDGEIVRLIVTEVIDYHHIALVWQGGDPEADIDETRKPGVVAENSKQPEVFFPDKNIQLSGVKPPEFWGFKQQIQPAELHHQHKEQSMKIEIQDIAPFLAALQVDSIESAEDLLEKIDSVVTANEDLRGELDKMKQLAEIGKQQIDTRRTEVKRLAGIIANGNPEAAQLAMVESADFATLEFLERDYNRQVKAMFPDGGRSSEEELDDHGKETDDAPAALNELEFQSGK